MYEGEVVVEVPDGDDEVLVVSVVVGVEVVDGWAVVDVVFVVELGVVEVEAESSVVVSGNVFPSSVSSLTSSLTSASASASASLSVVSVLNWTADGLSWTVAGAACDGLITVKNTIANTIAATNNTIPAIAAITNGLLVCHNKANFAPKPGYTDVFILLKLSIIWIVLYLSHWLNSNKN